MKLFSRKLSGQFLLSCFFAAIFFLPVFWMVAASLQPRGTPLPTNGFFSELTTQNFSDIRLLIPLEKFTLNSLLVVGLAVPITLLVSSLAGFGIAQLPQISQRRWVVFSLAVLMVPGIALWMSRFMLYKAFGWYNTIWALIAPAWMGTSPFYVLVFYRAFRRIPYEIYASARLDGANVLCLWANIGLPMVKPTIAGVAFLSFLFYWGDYVSPLLYLQTEDHYTLAVVLQLLRQMSPSDWSLLLSAAVYMMFFPFLFFIFIQKRIGDG